MIVAELIKLVDFNEVEKELLLTDKGLESALPKLASYYKSLKDTELSLKPLESKIEVSREYFDRAYFLGTETKDAVEEATTFIPAEVILASKVADEDLLEEHKALIVTGILCFLTFDGTCFSEDERKAEVEAFKQQLSEEI